MRLIVGLLLLAICAAAVAGPIAFAHFHAGLVFGVFVAWLRWRDPNLQKQRRSLLMPAKPTRGIRNNNPGNIDRNATKWQGMAEDQSGDPRFVVFKAPKWGIRAIARLLLTYQNHHYCNTVRKIIGRWAPPNENNTGAYVAAVALAAGVKPDEVIDVDQVGVMLPLIRAIITHENGGCPYPDSVILEGMRLAGVADAKPPPLVTQKPFVAQVAGGAAIAASAVAPYSEPLKKAANSLADFTGAPIIAHAQTVLLTLAGACVIAGLVATWLRHRAA